MACIDQPRYTPPRGGMVLGVFFLGVISYNVVDRVERIIIKSSDLHQELAPHAQKAPIPSDDIILSDESIMTLAELGNIPALVVLLEKLAQEEHSILEAKKETLAPDAYIAAQEQIAEKYEGKLNTIFRETENGKKYLEFLEDRNKKRPPVQISI